MHVKAVAHVRNQDMRRILKKPECEPGDEFDLPDSVAKVYLKNGWVVPSRKIGPPVEFAVTSGAPEQAISARGRGRPRRTPNTDNE